MVKSGTIYSPQNYLELVTGKCFMIDGENDVKFELVVPAEIRGKVPSRACFAFLVRGAAEATFSDFEVEKEAGK